MHRSQAHTPNSFEPIIVTAHAHDGWVEALYGAAHVADKYVGAGISLLARNAARIGAAKVERTENGGLQVTVTSSPLDTLRDMADETRSLLHDMKQGWKGFCATTVVIGHALCTHAGISKRERASMDVRQIFGAPPRYETTAARRSVMGVISSGGTPSGRSGDRAHIFAI